MNITVIAKNFVNLIYPLHCAGCKKPIEALNDFGICPSCEAGIRPNPEPYCVKCGRPLPIAGDTCEECRKADFSFSIARSPCLYEGTLKELIHLFKYKGKVALSKVFLNRMANFIRANDYIDSIDFVTFIPIHKKHERQRDFNHSKVLAVNISKAFGLRLEDTLEKRIATRHQNELSRKERLTNLAGAFNVKRGAELNGSRILLVDDVMTTGATCSECAKALRDAGAAEVRCITLARGL